MAHATQAGRFQRQIGGRNIHTHTAHHDGNQFFFTQAKAKIIYTRHLEVPEINYLELCGVRMNAT
jgi:hypothetical protein